MPLPSPDCPDAVLEDYCCEDVPALANRIRSVAFNGILDCVEHVCSDREMRSFVSHGPRVEDPLGDSLIVYILDLTPTLGSRNPQGRLNPVAVYTARFEVWLHENGWPMAEVVGEGDAAHIVVPDAEIVHGAATHMMAHGMRMYRELAEHIQKRTLFPSVANLHVGRVGLGPLQPTQPTSNKAGFKCVVEVELTLGTR